MRATPSARALMTTNNVQFLTAGRRVSQLLVADRSPVEGAIAARAIQRLNPHHEVRSVASLVEAESLLARAPVATIFVASGLDSQTHAQTIRWFADNAGDSTTIALLEHCDDRHRQEALEAGASFLCSKPDLLVAQLRREAEPRLDRAPLSRSAQISRYRSGSQSERAAPKPDSRTP
jgi:DNA-binding NarL/FixJ family response regulator